MPLEVQIKLLRVIEYGEFSRVGSNKVIQVDVRYLYATNKDLIALSEENKFRKDLYYRICTLVLKIPPLRDRPDDIIPLIDHFLKRYDKFSDHTVFTSGALKALHAYTWPGNIRELKNLIERLCILYKGEKFDISKLPEEMRSVLENENISLKNYEIIEKNKISMTLIRNNWNILQTSKDLQIPRTTLSRKIKQFKIKKNN